MDTNTQTHTSLPHLARKERMEKVRKSENTKITADNFRLLIFFYEISTKKQRKYRHRTQKDTEVTLLCRI